MDSVHHTTGDTASGSKEMKMKADSLDFKHQCPHCTYAAKHPYQIKDHVKAVHYKIKKFSCHMCDFKGSRRSKIKDHVNAVHKQIKNCLCEHCDYRVARNADIKRHMKSMHADLVCD